MRRYLFLSSTTKEGKSSQQRLNIAVAFTGLFLLLAIFASEEYLGVILTVLACSAIGVAGLSLIRDVPERRVLTMLLVVAFGVRLVFTVLFYESDLARVLGGADDTGWLLWWKMSRLWHGWPGLYWFGATPADRMGFDPTIFPSTLSQVYTSDAALNRGTSYFSTWFYYLLDIRSQPALAILNGFLNALTVLLIYKIVRAFYSQRAALFTAGAAIILPSFLLWSALTVKESWVILCDVALFYGIWRLSQSIGRKNLCNWSVFCAGVLAILWSLRFYAAGISGLAALVAWLCFRTRRPLQAVGFSTSLIVACALFWLLVISSPEQMAQHLTEQLNRTMEFRTAISVGDARWGTNSGVPLDYNLHTVEGIVPQLLVGTGYVLLSPFPWQTLSGRQVYVLPEIVLWWLLFLGLMLPGLGYMARYQPRLCLALGAFLIPPILLFALLFGNIGLAHRQRAQLAPFLLIFAAAGYEQLLQRRRGGLHSPDPLVSEGRHRLQT